MRPRSARVLPLRLFVALALALAVAASAPACAGRDEVHPAEGGPTGRATSAVIEGTPDRDHHATIEIREDGRYRCTGLLIAPDLVLTARHCVATTENSSSDCGDEAGKVAMNRDPLEASTLRVRTENAEGAAIDVAVAEVLVVPDSNGLPTCGRDIGMLRLGAAILEVTPTPMRIDVPPRVGETLTVIGFGTRTPPPKKTLEGRVARTDLTVLAVGAGTDTQEGEWSSSAGPCFGDSGAPALDAEGASIGIVSHGPDSCGIGIYQRLDTWAPWIRERMRDAWSRNPKPTPDAAAPDAAAPDAAAPDAAAPDLGQPSESGCAVAPSRRGGATETLGAILLGLLLVQRRRPRSVIPRR